mmetsp:Transcript_18743/g.17871  ORF Transcript_18743/g.17871 Transcript_18743/m.17871 type:complete len:268 (+) Transcript_18743:787-1590(+)
MLVGRTLEVVEGSGPLLAEELLLLEAELDPAHSRLSPIETLIPILLGGSVLHLLSLQSPITMGADFLMGRSLFSDFRVLICFFDREGVFVAHFFLQDINEVLIDHHVDTILDPLDVVGIKLSGVVLEEDVGDHGDHQVALAYQRHQLPGLPLHVFFGQPLLLDLLRLFLAEPDLDLIEELLEDLVFIFLALLLGAGLLQLLLDLVLELSLLLTFLLLLLLQVAPLVHHLRHILLIRLQAHIRRKIPHLILLGTEVEVLDDDFLLGVV